MILLSFKGCVVCETDDTRANSESWDSTAVAPDWEMMASWVGWKWTGQLDARHV